MVALFLRNRLIFLYLLLLIKYEKDKRTTGFICMKYQGVRIYFLSEIKIFSA